nr:hypothetical protein [Tanacetum cinerariifolium]
DQGIFDSGCSRNMIGNKSFLTDFQEIDGGFVTFGGSPKGGKISRKDKIRTGKLDFEDVYFVKEFKFNLFFVSQMCDKKNSVLFTKTECLILSPDFKLLDENQVLLKALRHNNMRLGHINFKAMNKLMRRNIVRGLPSKIFENDYTCVAYQKGKQHKASYKTKLASFISQPLQMLHMDLFGPTFVKSLNNKMYCLVVTDEFSRFRWVFFLASKDETSGILKSFITGIENQINHRVKIIRCDNRTEFRNSKMNHFCQMKGIKREFSVARTPQQNKVVERKNRTLIEAARTMLADSLLLLHFGLKQSLNLDFMKPFGCPVTILNTLDHLGKFKGKADEGFLVEYSVNSKAFRVFNSRTRKVEENLHIKFLENKSNVVRRGSEIDDQEKTDSNTQDVNTVGPSINTANTNINTGSLNINIVDSNDPKPKKVIRALIDPSWIEAIQEELLQFKFQKVWTLVVLSNGKRAIRTKWVFRNKKGERGIVVRNKARLVAQGYTQEEGINYDKVFAHVARIEAVRLAYASFMGFIVYHMVIKSAFLYGTIEEEVGIIDKTLFIKKDRYDILLVQVYIDDIIFGSTKKSLCDEFEQMMHKRFQMSSMRELTFFLGLQVKQKDDGIFISQDKFQVTPKPSHLHAMKRIFRYLKGQPQLGLWYPRDSPFDLEDFSDSDYTGASLDKKSTTREYVAATNFCRHVLWIQNQMLDYGFNFINTKIYIDNESIICIVKNLVFHSKIKHIEIRHNFIKDSYEKKLIQVIKIHTDHNVIDLLTKAFDVALNWFGDDISIKFRVTTGYCRLNAARQDLVLLVPPVVEGEGSRQPSEPQPPSSTTPPKQVLVVVGDEVVYTGEDDKMVWAATTTASIEAEQESGSGPRRHVTTLEDTDAQTRFETASKQSHDPPLSEINTSGSGEDSMEHQDDLMDFVPPTHHDLPLSGGHKPRSDEDLVIKRLRNKIKRLEKKQRARTPGMKLFKIGTSKKKTLDKENVSK